MNKNQIKVICKTCGKEFNKKKSWADRCKEHYCSMKCKRTYKIVKCAYCLKEIKIKGSRLKERNYCNISHQLKYEYENGIRERKPSEKLYKAHKKKCSGKNNYMWKGGKRKWKLTYYDSYYQTKWQELRLKIYERDNWTCQICGVNCQKKNKIQCHHIVPYRISQDNSESNLITLCVKCHRIEELKYFNLLIPVIKT